MSDPKITPEVQEARDLIEKMEHIADFSEQYKILDDQHARIHAIIEEHDSEKKEG
jgi:hypothetical protein